MAGRSFDPLFFLPAAMMTYLVLVLQFISLALWVGGTTVLLVIVAPSSRITSPEDAGALMLLVFKRFHGLLAGLQLLLLATLFLQLLLLSGSLGLKLRLAMSFVSVALLLTVHFRYTVLPRFLAQHSISGGESKNPGESPAIRSWGRSMMTLGANLFFGISVVIILILPF